jgi:hypothetical protein
MKGDENRRVEPCPTTTGCHAPSLEGLCVLAQGEPVLGRDEAERVRRRVRELSPLAPACERAVADLEASVTGPGLGSFGRRLLLVDDDPGHHHRDLIRRILEREIDDAFAGACTTVAAPQPEPPLTLERILETRRQIEALGEPVALNVRFFTLPEPAPELVPARTHRKKRIRKKWLKRYGLTARPVPPDDGTAYVFDVPEDPLLFGYFGQRPHPSRPVRTIAARAGTVERIKQELGQP